MSVIRGGCSGRAQPSTLVHGCRTTTLVVHLLLSPPACHHIEDFQIMQDGEAPAGTGNGGVLSERVQTREPQQHFTATASMATDATRTSLRALCKAADGWCRADKE